MVQNVARVKLAGLELVVVASGVTATSQLQVNMTKTKARMQDLKPVWLGFEPIWREQNQMLFAQGGIPKWPQLSPAYAERKYREVGAQPILVYSGRLRASLATATPYSVYVATPRSLRVGTAVPYSRFNQGKRPHVVMLPQTLQELKDLVTDYLTATP